MRKKVGGLALAVVGTALLVSACGTGGGGNGGGTAGNSTGTNPGKPVNGGTLNVAVQSDIPSLVPTVGVDTESIQYIDSVYSQLVSFSPTSLKIVPALAKSWTWNSNNTAITFHLRNAKFSNGDPVTAQDVLYSVEFVLNPKSNASINIYAGLQGAQAYEKNPTGNFNGVKVINNNTVEFFLNQPEPYFLASLAAGTGSILDQKVVQQYNFNLNQISTHAVGAGPYMVKSWTPGQSLIMVKNPYYWQKGLPHINEINTQIGVQPSSQFLMFQQGKLDLMGAALDGSMQIDSNSYLSSMNNPKLKSDYMKNVGLMTNFLSLNVQMAPFTNVKVRQAVAYAIDRAQLVQDMNGRAVPAYQLMPPGLVGYSQSMKTMPENLQKAKQLLQQAGYSASNPAKFDLVTLNDPLSTQLSAAIQSQLDKVGFKVTLKPEAQAPYIQGLLTPNTDQANYGEWIDDYPDGQDFLYNNLDGNNKGGFDVSYYNNPTVDHWIQVGDTSFNNATRAQAYETADQIANQQGAVVPLFYSVMDILKQPWVQPGNKWNYIHQVLPIQFWQLWLTKH
ncbi:ABC transporter substrate-binding protein [Alicyclobacillus sp. ALC3]|uniref:ABC transporter substrate-binding protein n=1 Tax=Alicyclobacillus sp. ALC3 TaxID=2796143 RepID=UPI002379EE5D|nr:ABC transporter substrate-binding protein [Alicyclobacillus sp. ALC3]WDL98431.1 ABC transporter substrate-binding protein [Alicyclobacillus sp. ALC3]